MNRTTRPRPTASGPDPKVIGLVVAFVVFIVFVAVVVISGDDPPPEAGVGEQGVVTTTGATLPALPDSGPDPAVGKTAPMLTSERPGDVVTVEPGEGDGPLMLVFLAHWCPHCQAELPVLTDLAEDGAFDGVRTVAVLTSTDPDRPNYPPSAWLDREGWPGDRLFDDPGNVAAAAYGVTSFPFTVYVDADGEVTRRHAGSQPPEQIVAEADSIRR